ncbi:hypothetical protein DES39_1174 [Orbus hercynius]|uniref:DUF4352 domain-containing protein n=1 Tax=Orbus hercynius TaxID=593135 RepID=A0A495REH9_9GAMM|nr:hypothetical protein [Orbus hercynius]RKS85761.1 hypothetical protein DES39_1174 [Orbus hercynius]
MKLLSILALLGFSFLVMAEDKTNAVKDAVSNVVSGIVSFSKNALSGVNQGVEEGRQDGESIDGARIISSHNTLAHYNIVLSISKVNQISAEHYEVIMVIRNNEAEPVRFINLFDSLNVILLDDEGFSSHLTNNYLDITVPAKAAIKSSWQFYGVEGKPDILRIYGQEIKVPQIIHD